MSVGSGKGTVHRQIVADSFFAVGEPGVTPTLASMDPNVYRGMPPDPGSLSVGYWSRRLRRSSAAALSSSACRTSWWVCCS